MNAKHTSAPWRLDNIWIPSEKGGAYAYPLGTDPDIATANAALIAASPELLAAAKLALDILDNITSKEFQRGGDKPARDALRSAIAAAEIQS